MHANSATICCSCDLRAPSGRKLTFDGIAVKNRGPFRSAEGYCEYAADVPSCGVWGHNRYMLLNKKPLDGNPYSRTPLHYTLYQENI